MLEGMFSAVTGAITEPSKGAKTSNILGSAVDFGKGFLGLISKPIKGTIDLVTQTTKGKTDGPSTMYVGVSKMTKKISQ